MLGADKIAAAVRILAQAAQPARILLFGSYARGDAREMVRLRRVLRPLRVPADVLVYSAEEVARWGDQPGSALYWALREGKVVHG